MEIGSENGAEKLMREIEAQIEEIGLVMQRELWAFNAEVVKWNNAKPLLSYNQVVEKYNFLYHIYPILYILKESILLPYQQKFTDFFTYSL